MEHFNIGFISTLVGILSFATNIKIGKRKVKKWLRKIWFLLAVAGIISGIYECCMGLIRFS